MTLLLSVAKPPLACCHKEHHIFHQPPNASDFCGREISTLSSVGTTAPVTCAKNNLERVIVSSCVLRQSHRNVQRTITHSIKVLIYCGPSCVKDEA
ncbi:hypothetical protein Tco_0632696 [Tanacetum coccineum]